MYLCPPLKFYAHDANGNPLSGGTLKTYLGTSSNPVQTFADAAGSVKNPQEITLDARGEANVFLDPSLTYMFILCDADGAEIYTQNGVKAPGSGGSAGASSVISTDGTVDVSVSVGSSGETVYDISVSAVVKSLQDALSSEMESRKAADAALSDGIAAEKSRAEAAEAAAKTEVVAGANATVKSATGANGQTIYTVSGNAPDVSITSTDASIDISETSTETSKTFNLSVNKNVKNFIGGFVVGTLSLGTQLKGTVSKESGTLAVSSDAIVLPAGTYSVTLKCAASTNTEAFNVYDAAISVMAKVSESVFNLFVFKPDVNSSGTQYFDHSFDITLSAQASISVWGKYETEQSSQGWTLDGAIYIHSVANVNAGGGGGGLTEVAHDATLSGDGTADNPLSVVGGGDTYEVKVNSAGTAGYLYDKVNTEVPIQKKVENDQLVIYQDPVQASPLSMISTPSMDNVLSTLNVVTNGTQQLSWIAIQAHVFTVPNYYTPYIPDIWEYININTQGASAEGVHFVGIYAYDRTTNTIHLVCMSVNGASHDNTATGIASLATGYVNTATGYNIIKPGFIYYAFHACDQTALTVAGNSSSTFNLSQPYPSLILYNLKNGLTVTDFVTNYGTIDLSTSTLSHQESTGKRFLAVRHAT